LAAWTGMEVLKKVAYRDFLVTPGEPEFG
jgi:hypothetical protein